MFRGARLAERKIAALRPLADRSEGMPQECAHYSRSREAGFGGIGGLAVCARRVALSMSGLSLNK
jgi:hypothetical protein